MNHSNRYHQINQSQPQTKACIQNESEHQFVFNICSVKYDKAIARRAIRPDSKIVRELEEGATRLCLVTEVSRSVLSD